MATTTTKITNVIGPVTLGPYTENSLVDQSTRISVSFKGHPAAAALLPVAVGSLGFLAPGILAKVNGAIQFREDQSYLSRLKTLGAYSWEHKAESLAAGVSFAVVAALLLR